MYRKLLFAALFWTFSATCFCQDVTPTPDDQLKAAKAAYDRKDYAESAALYERPAVAAHSAACQFRSVIGYR